MTTYIMDFREYFKKPTIISFQYENTLIIIQEILLTEALVGLNYYSTNEKRFKITFLAPKNRQSASIGHYEPETIYVAANHANEAKEKLYNWLAHTAGIKSKGRRYALDQQYMSMKTRQVTTWKDLKELINYLSQRRMNNDERLSHFGKNELGILFNQIQQPQFTKQVEKFQSKEQILIKKLVQRLAQERNIPAHVLNHAKYWGRKYSQPSFQYDEPDSQNQQPERWSVYAPKTPEEHEKLLKELNNLGSVKDVVSIANRYGIGQKELFNHYANDYYSGGTKYYHEDQAAELHKWLRNKMGKEYQWRKVAAGDFSSLPFSWEALVRQASETGYDHPLTYLAHSLSAGGNYQSHDIEQAFWDFYTKGPPQQTPQYKRLTNTLENMLQGYGQEREPLPKAAGYYDEFY